MPPKGKKHLSYADVQDRKKELDEKLKKWVKDMDDAGIKEPNQAKLQETFTKAELAVFWKRLERKRGSSALTIRDAWKGLKDMRRLLKDIRWKTLIEFLLHDDASWQQTLVTAYKDIQAATTKATSPATSASHHHNYFHSASVPQPAMTHNKEGETRQFKHDGSCADDDDDERCRCAECGLKFHREMARWCRELLRLKPDEDRLQGRRSCNKMKAGLMSKSKKRPVKEDKNDGRPPVKQRKRSWMPCSTVIREISASTLLEPEDVKLVLDDVKRLSTEEVMNGHTFLFPGLALFKMDDEKRVVARACEGRAWNCVNVYGKRGKWR